MTAPDAHLVLAHDGDYYHHFPKPDAAWSIKDAQTVLADGQPATALAGGWYRTDSPDTTFEVVTPEPTRTVGWTLRDGDTASVRFPAHIDNPADIGLHTESEDDCDMVHRLYTPVTEQRPARREPVTAPVVRMDGPPAPHDGLAWQASLPTALTQRPEFAHLFSGALLGYRAAVKAAIGDLPRVKYVFEGDRPGNTMKIPMGHLRITVEVPYGEPVRRKVPVLNANGSPSRRRSVVRETKITRELLFNVPDQIAGPDRAAATRAWNDDLAAILDEITAASFDACNDCDGTGMAPTALTGRATAPR